MKYILICCCIVCVMFGACGSHDGNSGSTAKPPDTATTTAPVTDGKNSGAETVKADTVLWVGLPARWIKRPDYILDGKYDSLEHIFIACGSQKPERIENAGMIAYDDVSNCDTSFRNSIRFLMKPLNGLPPQLTSITVEQDPKQLVAKMPMTISNGTKAVMLKPVDEARIRAAAFTHLNVAYRQKMLLPVKQ